MSQLRNRPPLPGNRLKIPDWSIFSGKFNRKEDDSYLQGFSISLAADLNRYRKRFARFKKKAEELRQRRLNKKSKAILQLLEEGLAITDAVGQVSLLAQHSVDFSRRTFTDEEVNKVLSLLYMLVRFERLFSNPALRVAYEQRLKQQSGPRQLAKRATHKHEEIIQRFVPLYRKTRSKNAAIRWLMKHLPAELRVSERQLHNILPKGPRLRALISSK